MDSSYSYLASASTRATSYTEEETTDNDGLGLYESDKNRISARTPKGIDEVSPPNSFGFFGRSSTLIGSPKDAKDLSATSLSLCDRFCGWIDDTWTLESIARIVSFTCILVLGVVLRSYDRNHCLLGHISSLSIL